MSLEINVSFLTYHNLLSISLDLYNVLLDKKNDIKYLRN